MADLDKVADELEGLLEKATPGPWKTKGMGGDSYVLALSHKWNKPCYWDDKLYPIALPRTYRTTPDGPTHTDFGSAGFAHDDAYLIVAAINALPALLEERKRMREALDAVMPFAKIGQMVADAWPEGSFEIDGIELQELLTEHGLIAAVPGGFNSNIHTDWNAQAPEEGDEWLMPTALDAKARAAINTQER